MKAYIDQLKDEKQHQKRRTVKSEKQQQKRRTVKSEKQQRNIE